MIPVVALVMALGQSPQVGPVPDVGQDPPRMRVHLPNGAELLVEPAPKAKTITVHLFASARGVDERKTSGLRHLLEHLCAKGADGKLDARLEANGAFLEARTVRDALDVQIDVAPGDLQLAFDGISDVLGASGWTAADLAREAAVIEQESVLQSDDALLTAAIWAAAYGGNGADPMGDLATIKSATPEQLDAVRKATFATDNLLLVIEGPVGLNPGVKLGTAFLSRLPATKSPKFPSRTPTTSPSTVRTDAYGEARGVPVPPLNDPACQARICAALAIAAELKNAYVTYTPSALNGMVVVGQLGQVGALSKYVDTLEAGDADELLTRGRRLGVRWAQHQVATPAASAYTRGLLMCRNPRFDFDQVIDAMSRVSVADFRAAVLAFKKGSAFLAEGTP